MPLSLALYPSMRHILLLSSCNLQFVLVALYIQALEHEYLIGFWNALHWQMLSLISMNGIGCAS
jgi:hypothetical protein